MSKYTIIISQSNKSKYPKKDFYFSPSKFYPEYPWKKETIFKKNKNEIYDLVRASLYKLGLDQKNFGNKNWNPLKNIIKPGMRVLIKPNMVMSEDLSNNDPELTAMISHPSIVKAIIDYVYIALKGEGQITIADAPLQNCNFTKLTQKVGYNKINNFYKKNAPFPIKITDLRQYVTVCTKEGLLKPIKSLSDPLGYSEVHLKKLSAHNGTKKFKKFRITNYDHRKMQKYHNENDDIYIISNTVLKSDVIISIPKLKTHRKAGMTCALKNFVGIIGHKDCLPHHSTGSKSEGGDEYLNKNIFKKLSVKFTEILNIAMVYKRSFAFPYLVKIIRKLTSFADKTQKDNFHEGSWYGNDTIWRTVLDLVRIAMYCNKSGKMQKKQQRKIFTLVDGIVAGEKEGPLEPTPKKTGIIIVGSNPAFVDLTASSIIGFDYKKIPTINQSFHIKNLPIANLSDINKVKIRSNNKQWNLKKPSNIRYTDSLKFIPSDGWLHHIEKT